MLVAQAIAAAHKWLTLTPQSSHDFAALRGPVRSVCENLKGSNRMRLGIVAASVAMMAIVGATGAEARRHRSSEDGYVGGRPSAWCGWWMRTQLGGGPEYNLAANWRHYGRSSGPQVGAVVVWSHHVGMITGRASNGQWIVKSGNDGGRVRERARSVSGAVFRVG